MIEPTVGRVVHFYPNADSGIRNHTLPGPWKADIVDVHNERLVNLAAFDPDGNHHALSSVLLVQPEDEAPAPGSSYACWMPYQVKGKNIGSESGEQAAGTEQI